MKPTEHYPFKSTDFKNFGVSVDCVVFGYEQGKVKVLLVKRNIEPYQGKWALIGDLVSPNSDLDSSANTILNNLTGLNDIFMEQFAAFGSIDRHPSGRVISIGYYSLVKSTDKRPAPLSWAKSTKWFNINKLPDLAFDHADILKNGIQTLNRNVRYRPVGFELLPNKFTLYELLELYETLLGCKFDKPNFRKKILGTDLLIPLDEVQKNVSHRPAKLYKFDEKRYQLLSKEGLALNF
jgi:8-oxo-dGTP diphosphatase